MSTERSVGATCRAMSTARSSSGAEPMIPKRCLTCCIDCFDIIYIPDGRFLNSKIVIYLFFSQRVRSSFKKLAQLIDIVTLLFNLLRHDWVSKREDHLFTLFVVQLVA